MFLFTDPKEVSDDAVFLLFLMAATLCIRVCLRRRCAPIHGSPRRLWWLQFAGQQYFHWSGDLELLVLDTEYG